MLTRHVLIQAFLHTLAIALVLIGAGGTLGFVSQQDLNVYNLALLPDRALPMMLLGLGLLAAARGHSRATQITTGIAIIVSLSGLWHYLPGVRTGTLSEALSAQTPLPLVLALAALTLPFSLKRSKAGLWLSRVVGLAAASLAVVAQLSDWWPQLNELRLGFKPDTNSLYCLLSFLLGIALILLPQLPTERRQLLDHRSLIAGSLGILLMCLIWFLLTDKILGNLKQESDAALNDLQRAVNDEFEDYSAMLQRFADRWEEPSWQPNASELDRVGRRYLRDFPYLTLLGILDKELHPQWLHERNPAALDQLAKLLAAPQHRAWLHKHRLEVRTAQLVSLGTRVFLVRPLRTNNEQNALLIAEIELNPLLSAKTQQFHFHISEDGRSISGDSPDEMAPLILSSRTVILPSGVQWQLQAYLSNPRDSLSLSQTLTLLIVPFGLCISFFLIYSLRLASLSTERNRHLRQANQALNESLKRQQSLQNLNQRIMQHSMDLLCSIDEQGRFSEVNTASFGLLGYRPDEMIGRPFLDFVLEEDRLRTHENAEASIAGRPIQGFSNRYRHKDGSVVHLLWSYAWSAEERSFFGVAHDISHLVKAEAYLEDQRDILGMISTNQPLSDILSAICRMSESRDPTALCSVQQLDQERQQLILNVAPSLPQSYLDAIDGVSVGPSCGSCGTAAYRKQMVLVEDIANDPLWKEYRELALRHNLRACWSIPLIGDNGQVFGTLAFYHRQPMAPDDQQMQLLATAAQLATIALERTDDRKSLQRSEQRFRSLFDHTPSAVFSLDLQGQIESVNQAACQLLDMQESELLGTLSSTLLASEDADHIGEHFRAARAGEARQFEGKFRAPTGARVELECIYLPILVEGAIVGVFAITNDVGARNQMERDLRTALLHAQRRGLLLRGLSDIAVQITGMFDNPKLVDLLCERLRSLIGAHQTLICLGQGDAAAPAHNALAVSSKHADWRDAKTSAGRVVQGRDFLEGGQALKLSQAQLQSHPCWSEPEAGELAHPPLRGLLAVPLQTTSGTQLGLLQLSDKYHGEFDADDLAIAEQFAQMTVVALENKRLMGEILAGEQRLREQLSYTATITDSIGEGLLAFDAAGMLSYANPTAEKLLDRSSALLLGQPLSAVLPIELDGSTTPAAPHGEFVLRREGKQQVRMSYDYAPLARGEAPNGGVMAFRDISAQALAEKAMRERDQFFMLSPELYCVLDKQGLVIQVNPALGGMLGYPEQSLIGHSCLEVIAPEDHEQAVQALRHVTQGEPLLDSEVRLIDVQANRYWMQFSAAQGEDQLIYLAGRDVNARKAAEKQLKATLQELERSNGELQEFAYVASHDLQEPLRKIQAFSERLGARATNLDPECQDYLRRMSSAAGRMQALIKDLLSYSRVTSRAKPFVRLDVENILDEVLQDMEETLSSSGAVVERGLLPPLVGEPTQIRQLLQNLLSNAAKFHAPGQPPRIHIYSEVNGTGEWTLCVEDQGIGFDEKYLDRIFNPFQRLHDRQAYAGTGIGLAIVKKIVEHHRASVTASSKPGHGSLFRITFVSPE